MSTVPKHRSTHQQISPIWLLSSFALILTLVASCMPIQPAATNLAASKAITLRFAISDAKGVGPSEPFELEFIAQVKTLSQGSITIEPVWDAGSGTSDGFEKGVIQLVRKGKFDLGLASSRTWDTQGVKSFQVLQAPFLITNDALAEAVATSAVAAKMLDSLSTADMVGLSLWPEGLRHPFSVVPDKPLLSPQDFVGAQIRTGASDVAYQLMKALGARPSPEDGGYQGADSGLLQAATLNGQPVATGNVTFYPKYQVLFANAAAFNGLSEAQRTLLRQAAAAAQSKAIAGHPREADAATAWCTAGRTIVLASAAQVAAFEQVAQPIFDQLAQDPGNATFIAAIRDLKAHTTPSPGAIACAPTATAKPASVPMTSTASVNLPRIVFASHPGGNDAKNTNSDPYGEIYGMNADGSGQTRLTNNHFWDGQPTASLDGQRIAFASNSTGNSQIYAMNADGSDVMRLTNNTTNDTLPVFSPDGTQIVFVSQRDGNVELYRMQADGSGQTRLTNNPAVDEFPSWSPDGTQISFDSERDNGEAEIYTMKTDGSDVVRLTNNHGRDSRSVWSPDGKKILFESKRDGNGEIYVMDPDGSGQTNLTNNQANDYGATWLPGGKQITFETYRDGTHPAIYVMEADGNHPIRIATNPGANVWPAWQPPRAPTVSLSVTSTNSVNLPRIVFVSHPDGNTANGDTNAEIYSMNADGTDQTRLTNNHYWDNQPTVSHDGKRIAFVSSPVAPDDGAQIYAMNIDGSDVIRLTNNHANDYLPVFSPDDTQITFFSDRDGNVEVYVMNADGSSQTNLTHNPALDEYPSWSPNGKQIIFNSTRDGGAGNGEIMDQNGEIYVMNVDGSGQTRLTHDGGHDGRPMWSPDGKKVVFETNRDGDNEIYVMNADGSQQTRLTNNPNNDLFPAWSLDGQQIVFTSSRDDGDMELYVMNADGSHPTRLTHNPGDDVLPAWQTASAPTASVPMTPTAAHLPRIVFSSYRDGNVEIYLMNADGSDQTRLTNNPAWDNEPTASRDGKRIAFVSDRDGNDEIYVMNADGSGQTRLTNNEAKDGLPAFSPDGKQLVFFSERDGNVEIYRMNADGSDQTNLTNNPAMDHYPSWSPDGKQILFNSARDGDANLNEVLDPNGEVYVMNADGSNQTRLTHDGGNDGRPLWSPDGKKIIVDTDRGDPAEIYVMNADGSGQTNLTHGGDTGSPVWSFDGKQISFTSNRTGDDEIYVMNADGTNQTALTHTPGQENWSAWLPAK